VEKLKEISMPDIKEWAEKRIKICEKLKASEFSIEPDEYFDGKIAILEDLLFFINKQSR